MEDNEPEEDDEGFCQFCGEENPAFIGEALVCTTLTTLMTLMALITLTTNHPNHPHSLNSPNNPNNPNLSLTSDGARGPNNAQITLTSLKLP